LQAGSSGLKAGTTAFSQSNFITGFQADSESGASEDR